MVYEGKHEPFVGQDSKNLQYIIPHSHCLFPAHAFLCRVPEIGGTVRCKEAGSLNHHFKESNLGVPYTRISSTELLVEQLKEHSDYKMENALEMNNNRCRGTS